jgi:hypothetical protein
VKVSRNTAKVRSKGKGGAVTADIREKLQVAPNAWHITARGEETNPDNSNAE